MKNTKVISKKCLECGDLFYKKQNESKKYWSNKKYCTINCSLKNTTIRKQRFDPSLINYIPWNKGTKGLIKPNSGSFKKGNPINIGRIRVDMQGEKNHKWVNSIKSTCSFCSKELFLKPWQIKNRNFCNRTCWALGTRDIGSPVYKREKAVSRLRGRIAQMPEYKIWHADVLKRDTYTCISCKSKKDLEVDHIKRFLLIANEYKIKSLEDARNCAELWDVNNGRTLCRICHRTTDTYGTKGTKKLST